VTTLSVDRIRATVSATVRRRDNWSAGMAGAITVGLLGARESTRPGIGMCVLGSRLPGTIGNRPTSLGGLSTKFSWCAEPAGERLSQRERDAERFFLLPAASDVGVLGSGGSRLVGDRFWQCGTPLSPRILVGYKKSSVVGHDLGAFCRGRDGRGRR